jgi:hypothetical protein
MSTFITAVYSPPEAHLPYLVVVTDGREIEVHPAKSKKAADALLILSEARWKNKKCIPMKHKTPFSRGIRLDH